MRKDRGADWAHDFLTAKTGLRCAVTSKNPLGSNPLLSIQCCLPNLSKKPNLKSEATLFVTLSLLRPVCQSFLKRFLTFESILSLHVTSIDHASHVHVKTTQVDQKLQTVLAK